MQQSGHQSRAGFTLIELLVVIGIISVFIGILLPALNKARAASQAVACQSNMRQIGLGFTMYCDANSGWLPSAGEDGDPSAPLLGPDDRGWSSEGLWFNAVYRATFGKTYDQIQLDADAGRGHIPNWNDHNVLICPSASAAIGVASGTDADQMSPDGYFMMHGYVDGVDQMRRSYVCYAMNYKLFNANVFVGRITRLRPASSVVLVYEKRTNAGEATAADDDYYNQMGGGAGKVTTAPLGRFKGDWKRLSTRHSHGANLLFADGHVEPINFRLALTPPVIGINDWNRPERIWDVVGPATK